MEGFVFDFSVWFCGEAQLDVPDLKHSYFIDNLPAGDVQAVLTPEFYDSDYICVSRLFVLMRSMGLMNYMTSEVLLCLLTSTISI